MRETPIGDRPLGARRMRHAGRASERTPRFSSKHGDAPNPSPVPVARPSWGRLCGDRAAHLLVPPAIQDSPSCAYARRVGNDPSGAVAAGLDRDNFRDFAPWTGQLAQRAWVKR